MYKINGENMGVPVFFLLNFIKIYERNIASN